MTTNSDFKRLVRARMASTGETYTAAQAALLALDPTSAPTADTNETDSAAYESVVSAEDLAFYDRTVRIFFEGPQLRSIPTKRKARVVVLLELLARFTPGRRYAEREVNEVLREAHDDFASLRRELIDYHYLSRADGEYWVTEERPEREGNVAQEVLGNEAAQRARAGS